MTDAPTPLDLDAIRQRATQGYPFLGLWAACNDALVLIEEVKRLRDACKTLGGVIDRQCIDIAKIARSEHLVSESGDADWGVIWERAYEIADRAEKAEAEVARLTARPDPAWDEEATRVALVDAQLASVRQVMEDGYPSIFVRSNEDAADAALAVVREHQPVKPHREALRVAHHRALMPQAMSIFAAVGGTQADYDALLDTLADAVLARFNITPKEDR